MRRSAILERRRSGVLVGGGVVGGADMRRLEERRRRVGCIVFVGEGVRREKEEWVGEGERRAG